MTEIARERSPWTEAALATALLAASILLAISFGSEPTSLLRAIGDPTSLDRVLVVEARLPRVLLAVVAGGGLSIVGAAYQALLRNPLAEPYVLGVSGGAALGATLAIAIGFGASTLAGASVVPLAALAGGLGATLLVEAVARASGTPQGASILLAGVIVNALASSLITLLKSFVSASQAQKLLFWLMGFVDAPTPAALISVSTFVVAGSVVLVLSGGSLNLLALGTEPAAHLGVDVRRLERRVFLASSAIVGAVVCVTGLIGFVGLVVPHALRRITGPDNRVLLVLSFFVGGATLALCDLVSRVAFRAIGTEPPVGAVTALFGGPLFLILLARKRG